MLEGLAGLGNVVAGFDSVAGDAADHLQETHDTIDTRALINGIQNLRYVALLIVLRIADAVSEDALDEDLSPSDALAGLMLVSLGMDDDEPLDDSLNLNLNRNIADALSSLGVSDEMIIDIMSEDDETADAALEAAADLVIANLPAEGKELDDFSNQFIYGFDAKEVFDDSDDDAESGEGYDSMKKPKKKIRVGSKSFKVDASGRKIQYKGVRVVRNHHIVVVNKRAAGQKFKLSADQKKGLKKMLNKSHSFTALGRRMKSLHIGIKNNIYKGKRAGHAAAAVKAVNTGMNKHYGDS
jgi:hypothetical protein